MGIGDRLARFWGSRSRREWAFAGVAGIGVGASVAALLCLMALDPEGTGPGLLRAVLLAFFVAPVVLVGVSLGMFGARIGANIGLFFATLAITMGGFMVSMGIPIAHGPRHLLLGVASGSIAEVAGREAAYVELQPALIDAKRIGTDTYTSTDKEGRSRTKSVSAAPIVTAFGERDPAATAAEVVHFFVCDDADDIRDAAPGSGTIRGRQEPLHGMAKSAVTKLGDRVRVADRAYCVYPTYGGGSTTGTLWAIAFVLYVLVFVVVGGYLLMLVVGPTKAVKSSGRGR